MTNLEIFRTFDDEQIVELFTRIYMRVPKDITFDDAKILMRNMLMEEEDEC